jgi:hypothetical protein
MRIRVELRRDRGEWIARFRPQIGIVGRLSTGRQEVQGRSVLFLHLSSVEPRQGAEPAPSPVLFEPRITMVDGDEFRVMGWELVDQAIHLQEWDCEIVPTGRVGYR